MSNRSHEVVRRALARGPSAVTAGVLLALAAAGSVSAQQGAGEASPEEVEEAQEAQEPASERISSPYRWVERSLRIGLYGGHLSADRGGLGFGPGSTEMGGARIRARISSPLSVEFGLGLGRADRHVVDPRVETGPAVVDTVASDWARADAAVQLSLVGSRTWNGLQPYVLFGTGLVVGIDEERSPVFESELEDLSGFRYEIGTAPIFQVGAGTELRVSDRLGLAAELRDVLFRLRAPMNFFRSDILDLIRENQGRAPENTEWTHNLELNVGVWYYF